MKKGRRKGKGEKEEKATTNLQKSNFAIFFALRRKEEKGGGGDRNVNGLWLGEGRRWLRKD